MGDLRSAFAFDNLKRAWNWTLTNPEAQYKNHFRDIYRAYSIAHEMQLNDLRKRLSTHSFSASHATKLYFPKKSGLQRTFALLSVEDQIVYQAIVNIIAEKLFANMRSRYYVSVFGNLYAGKRSKFFFNDWRRGYKRFSKAIRSAYRNGLKYAATFDLTACYDSIDHSVLKHFLRDLGFDAEASDYLNALLRQWTASSSAEPIYHGHGIPQGPQPSGLLAETVLRHFDQNMKSTQTIKYFRYVDDIRLFATSENELRHALVSLDLLSREIGLFPQSSKIEIHRVTNIENELKSISNPPEDSVASDDPNQKSVRLRLQHLSKNLHVEDETRFKYVLGRAAPNAELAKRLLRIVRNQPHLYMSIFRYLEKSTVHSRLVSKDAIDLLNQYELYAAFSSALINSVTGRLDRYSVRRLKTYCSTLLKRKDLDLNLRTTACRALVVHQGITKPEILRNAKWHDWWVRSKVLTILSRKLLGEASLENIVNDRLRDREVDSAVVAAEICINENIAIAKPTKGINKAAQITLREAGMIGRTSKGHCTISRVMTKMLGKKLKPVDWRKLLGKSYKVALRKVVALDGYSQSDPTGWVNLADVFIEHLLNELYRHDVSLGTYNLGHIGSVLSSTRLSSRNPKMLAAANAIHNARLQSYLSHPVIRKSGKPTRRITYKEMESLQRKLRDGLIELWSSW